VGREWLLGLAFSGAGSAAAGADWLGAAPTFGLLPVVWRRPARRAIVSCLAVLPALFLGDLAILRYILLLSPGGRRLPHGPPGPLPFPESLSSSGSPGLITSLGALLSLG
jgi:hypothetical protein